MRKLYLFNMVTLDGYFEGPKKWEIDWHNVDDEFNEFAINQLNETDAIIFGRVTYEGMASYWPTPRAIENDPVIAAKMNSIPKLAFSRTLKKAEWSNTSLVSNDIGGEISRLKGQPGKDLGIFGSANLASSLNRLGLIDEYRLIVNPVILGSGNPLFRNLNKKQDLRLVRNTNFKSGNVLLVYRLNGQEKRT